MGYSVLRFADKGDYELGEIEIVNDTLTHVDRVLELGTGIGFLSAFAAKRIGSDKIFTYDANYNMENDILRLYKRNNVSPTLVFSMLGEKDGKQNFYISKIGFFGSSTKKIENSKEITVDVRSLNSEIEKIKPTYLIIDIEGAEYDIFSIINFSSIRKIQFELHPHLLDEASISNIFFILASAGFVRDFKYNNRNNYFFYR